MPSLAVIFFDCKGGGEFAFSCITGQISGAGNNKKIEFFWAGNDEMDEAGGTGWANLEPNGSLKGQICFSTAMMQASSPCWKTSSTAC
jgi:hypothetical protein